VVDTRFVILNCRSGNYDQTLRLWDGATGHPLGDPLEHTNAVCCVAYSQTENGVRQ